MPFDLQRVALTMSGDVNSSRLEQNIVQGGSRRALEERTLGAQPHDTVMSLVEQMNDVIGLRLTALSRWWTQHRAGGGEFSVDAAHLPVQMSGLRTIDDVLLNHESGRPRTISEAAAELYWSARAADGKLVHAQNVATAVAGFTPRTSFLSLDDTPGAYVGTSYVICNSAGTVVFDKPPSNARVVDLPDTPSSYPTRNAWMVTETDTQYYFRTMAQLQRWQYTNVQFTATTGNTFTIAGSEYDGYMLLVDAGDLTEASDFTLILSTMNDGARLGVKIIRCETASDKLIQPDAGVPVTFGEGNTPQSYIFSSTQAHIFRYSTSHQTYYRIGGVL